MSDSVHGVRGLGSPRTPLLIICFAALTGLIQPRLVVPGLGAAGRPAALFSLALFIWWGFGRLLPTPRPVRPGPLPACLFAYSVTFLAAMGAGIDRGLPSLEQRSMDRALLITLGLGGVILVAQDTIRSVDDVERVLTWLVGLGAVSAVVALLQFAFGLDLTTRIGIPGLVLNADQAEIATRGDVGYRRVRGMALHPIVYGVHLAMLIPAALHLAMYRPDRRWLRWFAVGLLLAGIPLSISRSGVLALAVAVPVFAIGLDWRQRGNLAAAAVVAVLGFMTVTPGLLGTIKSLFLNTSNDSSVAGRTGDYEFVGEFVADRPLLGRGPGTYIPALYRTLDNQYLASLLETGWLGLSTLFVVLCAALWMSRRLVRSARSAREASAARALGAGIAVAPVTFLTFDALGFPVFAGALVVLIGACSGLYRHAPTATPPVPSAPTAALPVPASSTNREQMAQVRHV